MAVPRPTERAAGGRLAEAVGARGVAAAGVVVVVVVVVVVEVMAVGQRGANLLVFAVRCALDPELVLPGVAAGGVPLVDGGEPGRGEPRLLGVGGAGVGDLGAEVVQGAVLAGVFQQDELERRSAMAKLA